jgi:threonine/homoserine/homoserine lactone efflux protein
VNSTLFARYVVAVILLVITPGPDMLFCLVCGLTGGPRAGFGAALGTASGEAVYVAASAGGLATIVHAAPGLLIWLRAVGAIVLIALGVNTLRTRGRAHRRAAAHRAYLRGLATDLLNPKTALFSVAFLPQFVDPQAGSAAIQFAVLGAVFVALEVAVDGTVGLQASRVARLLGKRRTVDTTAGSVLLVLGVALAVAH